MFLDYGSNLSVHQNEIAVKERTLFHPRSANGEGRTIGARHRKCFYFGDGVGSKGGFADQILRIVASDEHFRQRHQVRACIFAGLPNLTGFGSIAGQIPNRRVQLRQCYAKNITHKVSCTAFFQDLATYSLKNTTQRRNAQIFCQFL